MVVQQDGVDAIAIGITHPRGNEDVVPAVCIQVADAWSPWPVSLGSEPIGNFLEAALSQVVIKGIPPDVVGFRALDIGIAPGDFGLGFFSCAGA